MKNVLFIDVIFIATGFVLRAIAGVIAIDVYLSPWLIVCTFLVALVLALGKRRAELEANPDPESSRKVLAEYSQPNIDQLLVMTMASLLMAYSLYTFSRRSPNLMVTLPFAFFGVFRYHHLIQTSDTAHQPEYLLRDRPSIVNLLLWGVVTIAVLYQAPQIIVGVL